MKTGYFLRILFLLFLALNIVSCSKRKKEDMFHLSRVNCIVNGAKYTFEEKVIQFPSGIHPDATHTLYEDSVNFEFFITCSSETNSGSSCGIKLRLKEKAPLEKDRKYRFKLMQREDVESIYDASAVDETYCYIEYFKGYKYIPAGDSVFDVIWQGAKGFAEGYVEFVRIDKSDRWVVGKLDLYLPSGEEVGLEAAEIKASFKLNTKFEM